MTKTSDAQLEANRRYHEKNKEKIKLMRKQYREKNKEYFSEYGKSYREENKEKSKEYSKAYYHNVIKTGDYRVYTLPNANYYVGYTSLENHRMGQHRRAGNDTTDYMILHICDTEEEALWFESAYHKIGFPGKDGKR